MDLIGGKQLAQESSVDARHNLSAQAFDQDDRARIIKVGGVVSEVAGEASIKDRALIGAAGNVAMDIVTSGKLHPNALDCALGLAIQRRAADDDPFGSNAQAGMIKQINSQLDGSGYSLRLATPERLASLRGDHSTDPTLSPQALSYVKGHDDAQIIQLYKGDKPIASYTYSSSDLKNQKCDSHTGPGGRNGGVMIPFPFMGPQGFGPYYRDHDGRPPRWDQRQHWQGQGQPWQGRGQPWQGQGQPWQGQGQPWQGQGQSWQGQGQPWRRGY
jgi:hypothetical protein